MRLAIVAWYLTVAAACGDGPPVTIAALDPAYGPMVGGTMTTIVGDGFESRPGDRPLVLIDGREAPIVITVDDDHLLVLTPPATGPGDVDVRVVIGVHAALAAGGFRYSTGPALDEATPRQVFHEGGITRVQLRGLGFADEGAGRPRLFVDGEEVEATVTSDRELSFVAPGGWPLREPVIELVNHRGGAVLERAFRYVPAGPGLLLYTFDFERFAAFVDPVDQRAVDIPRLGSFPALESVVRGPDGRYWGLDSGGRVGVLDMSSQDLIAPRDTGRFLTALERVGDGFVALDEGEVVLGRLDVGTGAFTHFTTWQPAFCPCALAFDGTRLLVSSRQREPPFGTVIHPLDPATGDAGAPLTVDGEGPIFIEEMRFFDGLLYALSFGGLIRIDPVTGAVVPGPVPGLSGRAIATYE